MHLKDGISMTHAVENIFVFIFQHPVDCRNMLIQSWSASNKMRSLCVYFRRICVIAAHIKSANTHIFHFFLLLLFPDVNKCERNMCLSSAAIWAFCPIRTYSIICCCLQIPLIAYKRDSGISLSLRHFMFVKSFINVESSTRTRAYRHFVWMSSTGERKRQ